jgi:hypothetical protein
MSPVAAQPLTPAGDVHDSWQALCDLTSAIRTGAAAEEWEQVVELAGMRHRAVLDHFERFPVGPDNAAFYHGRLTDMLRGEQELQAIAVSARRELMRLSVVSRQSHRAVGAYLADR